mmetsp:Transcript_39004/g.110629  ORF Transcript_39004/g.110629 Transcript_39004/m.110629 type:complete len:522 (-) Transcript_39004:167-1732(-)
MRVQVLQDPSGDTSMEARRKFADSVLKKFRRIRVLDLLARLSVHDSIRLMGGEMVWTYCCRFEFMPLGAIHKKVSHLSAKRVEDTMKGIVTRRLKAALKRVITQGKQLRATVVAKQTGGEEGEMIAMDEEAAERDDQAKVDKADRRAAKASAKAADGEDDDGGAVKKSAKKRRVMGAADKAANQEEKMDDEGDDKDGGDSIEESSGMYSSDEGEKELDDPDDCEIEEKDDAAAKAPNEEADEDLDDEEAGDEIVAKGSKIGKSSKSEGKAKDSTVVDAELAEAEALVREAVFARNLVWTSKLKGDVMTIIISHRYKDCPHSLFIAEMLREICDTVQLQDPACEGVQTVNVVEEQGKNGEKQVFLECEGINLFGFQVLPMYCIDHAHIYTNNVAKVLTMYGVEAARTAIVREVNAVFGHYGIDVDYRHLYLIADYMAHLGGLRAFNRHGMNSAASPFQQMSYETAINFLSQACQDSVPDNMQSPAAAIVLGQVPLVGTGSVKLLMDLNPVVPAWKQQRQFKW